MSKNKNVENKKAEDLNERWRLLYGAEDEDVSEGEDDCDREDVGEL